MRALACLLAVLACAGSVAAGPIDEAEYRGSFRIDGGPGVGPAPGPYYTAYPLGGTPTFGVVASNNPDWQPVYRAYPGADFAFVPVGSLTQYIVGDPPAEGVSADAAYSFDFELRDAAGRVGVVPLRGRLTAGWWSFGSYAFPTFADGSVRVGGTRYDVKLGYETALVYYQNFGGDLYFPWRLPSHISEPFRSGDYTTQSGVILYATVTATPEPVGTPEPGTHALAAIGLCGLCAGRRVRRAAALA
jgi:hypothetical protein